jgi:DNA-binding CsgD family transcriptional regulator
MNGVETAARLAFLEAAYDWKAPQEKWLTALLDAAAVVWGKPRYGFAYVYDASDPANLRFDKPVLFGPSSVDDLLARALDAIMQLPAEVIAASYRTVSVGFGRPLGVLGPEIVAEMASLGTEDVFALNAIDGTGLNCAIGLGVERTTLTPEEILLYQRLNSHLASAYRCRRRLEREGNPLDDCEAILDPDGRLLEARGEAKATAEREALHTASRSREDVRRHRRDDEPTRAWIPRIRTRWTLVDAFSSGGERYIVARENQAATSGLEVLTERERQVVAGAALGRTAKEIAYDLGISASTVRVLLGRARSRLGVRSDEEFQQLPAIRALRGA